MGTINVDNIKGGDGGSVTSLDVDKIDAPGDLTLDVTGDLVIDTDGAEIKLQDGGTRYGTLFQTSSDFGIKSNVSDKDLVFKGEDGTSTIEAARFSMANAGTMCFGRTSPASSQSDVHVTIAVDGTISANRASGVCGFFGRNDDGFIFLFYNNGTSQGSISVSGGTVAYNTFMGAHPSRLSDNSKPTILKGTIIETIDELMDWYQLEFTKDTSLVKVPYLKPSDKNVGDTVSYKHTDDVTYNATIKQKDDEKHVKCKISDTADSTRVYGVFQSFDEEDMVSADGVNDINISAVGTYPVRIHKDQTVSAGDLLVSNGDGTAKKQSDDIIRSKTIGKVLTNIKTVTHSDGSYLVPCALYCG